MRGKNITMTLPPKIMEILDNLYESGRFRSRTQVMEVALYNYLSQNNLLYSDKKKCKNIVHDDEGSFKCGVVHNKEIKKCKSCVVEEHFALAKQHDANEVEGAEVKK